MDDSIELKPLQQQFNLALLNGEEISFAADDLYIPPNALKIFLDSFEGPSPGFGTLSPSSGL